MANQNYGIFSNEPSPALESDDGLDEAIPPTVEDDESTGFPILEAYADHLAHALESDSEISPELAAKIARRTNEVLDDPYAMQSVAIESFEQHELKTTETEHLLNKLIVHLTENEGV